ncbi:MAG: peptidase M1 [Terriglobia bacterium]|nr:MAG: peptidase M1 [Terriglobia bacterium]
MASRAGALAGVLIFLAALYAADVPKLRLDDTIRPVRYAVELTLLPDGPGFSGKIDIDIEFRKPAAEVWLNAADLQIQQASLERGGRILAATIQAGDPNFVGLRLPSVAPAGPAKLHISFQGKVSTKNTAGIFVGRDGSETYLFSQFETTDARRAFPCFDQPNFKTPWQLTLHVKKEHRAFSNTPQVSENEEPGGMKRVVFAPTKPLPSYLIALAVGPFEIVDGGTAGINHFPVRIVTPKGKAYQARYAAEVTAAILDRLEKYFGVPYPFEKADQIAVPLTIGFGAMENAGLVTYAQSILLADPSTDAIQRQRIYASVAAHELAHQWFGDLVTLAWWDDAWLNEAFATWASNKTLAAWHPEWNTRLSDLGSKYDAMSQDSLTTARKIRQPIESMDDIASAFDGITYQKGAAVIRMFESWVGEKHFQAGVNSYLRRYALRAATANDFLDAISGTGQPRLAAAFSTFLQQSGLPEVSVQLRCDGAPRLTLNQKRYRPIGSAPTSNEAWQIPVCVRYKTQKGTQTECFLLDKSTAEFRLSQSSGCPEYISANDGATGYYLVNYDDAQLTRLIERGNEFLDPGERRTLLHDLQALAAAGEAKESSALDAAARFAGATERPIVIEAQSVVRSVRPLVPVDLHPNYARFVRKVFGERAAQLGWQAKSGEDSETRLLRSALVPFVASEGDDARLSAEARRLAEGWLRNRGGVDNEIRRQVLLTAARGADRAFFDSLLRELRKTDDVSVRQQIVNALGAFRDPQIAWSALDLLLHSDLDPKESLALLFPDSPETAALRFDFVKANYEALLERMPTGGSFDVGAYLPLIGQDSCDEKSRTEFVSFFEQRARNFLGGPRTYAGALERIQLCEAQRAAQGEDITKFFEKQ